MSVEGPHSFWEWSLDRYAQKGVASLLLKLQDDFGLNVNVMLWCLWCAERFEQLPELALRKAHDLTSGWASGVTVELRAVRKRLKSPPPQADPAMAQRLRERVKKAELDAEEIEQAMLDKLAREVLQPATSGTMEERARRNLAGYAALAGAGSASGFSVSLLEELLETAHPDARLETSNAHDER